MLINKEIIWESTKLIRPHSKAILQDNLHNKLRAREYGGSPGLVVMGGDSCSKGRGFESRYCILDGHFSRIFVVKIVGMFVWKDQK